ncbi:putative paramyosin [Operophtera brumata]|uniref:Putative paramyosin n=1 Tax=Operophtera brumata TaxID=104452 RepID=A0A0L7KLG5_OPEBR|nr:putative paramyosin [Operophtera brumata]
MDKPWVKASEDIRASLYCRNEQCDGQAGHVATKLTMYLLWVSYEIAVCLSVNVGIEDIRDALISVVHLLRLSEDKLERHEYREKALGQDVKRMLSGLEKKHRALEPMKGMISRMDDRLSNKASDEKSTQKKTNEALDNIQKSLQSLTTTDALRTMCQGIGVVEDGSIPQSSFVKHISEAEKLLTKYELKLNEYNGTRGTMDNEHLNEVALADEAWHNKMTEEMVSQGKEITKVQRFLSDAEGMWKELPRLNDLQLATNRTLDAIVNATENVKENQDKSVDKVTSKLREMGDRLEATNKDIQQMTSHGATSHCGLRYSTTTNCGRWATYKVIQQSLTQGNTMTERAYSDISRSYESLRTEVQRYDKLREMGDLQVTSRGATSHCELRYSTTTNCGRWATYKVIQQRLTQGNTMTERAYSDISRSYESLRTETADNVLATKKRIEYGVQQILMTMTELVLRQGKGLNTTFNDRQPGSDADEPEL